MTLLPTSNQLGACLLLLTLTFEVLASSVAQDRAIAIAKKLELLQHYLQSERTLQIDQTGQPRSRALLQRARDRANEAMLAYGKGEMDNTEARMNEAFATYSELVDGTSAASHDRLVARNTELRDEINTYLASYREALLQRGPGHTSDYNPMNATMMLAEADRLGSEGDLNGAQQLLKRIVFDVVSAVSRLRESETVTYALDFRTPADEYRYEQGRHESYTMMVTSLHRKQGLSATARKMSLQYVDKGNALKARAEKEAQSGQFEAAIKTMEEANRLLGRALQMLGVPITG